MMPPVVDAAYVREHPAVRLVDVRWYLDGTDAHAVYRTGHLPGAVFVDVDAQLSDTQHPATDGRHPLPDPARFASVMSELGIGDDTPVVAYDDTGGLTAGRLAVMLRITGHDAAILDGGIAAWDGPLATGDESPPAPATFTTRPWPTNRLADVDEVARRALDGTPVLDARSAERYQGAAMVDPRAGHIPGAHSAPSTDNLRPDGRMRPVEELRARFIELGLSGDAADVQADVEPSITYCGSGVSACLNIIAAEHAGLRPPRLYVASWSGWSADPDRPAE